VGYRNNFNTAEGQMQELNQRNFTL